MNESATPDTEYVDSDLKRAHAMQVDSGERFAFGANWASFLNRLDEERIQEATLSLKSMLGVDDLTGRTFLDAGSGSGLFSLAARRLGAQVHSFDFDPDSVGCTRELRRRYYPEDPSWRIDHGSVLDDSYLATLGKFDVVYSWGVLHHTGAMWRAIANTASLVAEGGSYFIAIYNDQGAWSRRWLAIKRTYCSGVVGRAAVVSTVIPYWVIRGLVSDLIWLRNPLSRYTGYRRNRGMSVTHDWFDWLGGLPFEVAKPEQILDFLRHHGFVLTKMTTVGGSLGCNQFVANKAPLTR